MDTELDKPRNWCELCNHPHIRPRRVHNRAVVICAECACVRFIADETLGSSRKKSMGK